MPLTLLAVCAIKITTIIHYSLNHVHVYFHGNDQFLEIILFPEKLYDLVNFNDAIIQVPKSYCYPDAYLILFRRWCYFQFYVYVYEVMLVCCSYDQWLMIIMSYYHFMHTYSWWKRRSWLWKEDHVFSKSWSSFQRHDLLFKVTIICSKSWYLFKVMNICSKSWSSFQSHDLLFKVMIIFSKSRSSFQSHDLRWSWLWKDNHK
jgi:hypothetical protein